MKSAFTMIELIFVIVILGILAAIAVPKLGGVKEKAEVTKAVTQFTTLVNDVMVYYNLHDNDVLPNVKDMTNTPDEIKVSGKTCVTFSSSKKTASDPAKLIAKTTGDTKCGDFYENSTIATMLNNYQKITAAASSTAVASRSTGVVYMDDGDKGAGSVVEKTTKQKESKAWESAKTCTFNLNTGVASCES